MNYFTKETYQTKREILNFSKKIAKSTRKPTLKFTQDMVYGILTRKNCYLSEIARALNENTKLPYTVDRLSSNLMNLDQEEIAKIKNNYYEEIMKYLPEDYVIVLNDDTDINKEYSKKLEDLSVVRDASSQTEKYVNGYKVCKYLGIKSCSKHVKCYGKIANRDIQNFSNYILTELNPLRPFQIVVSDMTAFWANKKYYELTLFMDLFHNEIIAYC